MDYNPPYERRAMTFGSCVLSVASLQSWSGLRLNYYSNPSVFHPSGHRRGERAAKASLHTFVLLRGRVRVNTYNDDGSIIDSIELNPDDGRYGVNIPKGVWHTIEALEPDSVIFECKEGPFVEHEADGILKVEKK